MVPPVFTDPDNDSLTFYGISKLSSIVSVFVVGTFLIASPIRRGSTTITVIALDGRGGSAADTFEVRVNSNPQVVHVIPDTILTIGAKPFRQNLEADSTVFRDQDGDKLTSVTSQDLLHCSPLSRTRRWM
jgi:hypothetical protein